MEPLSELDLARLVALYCLTHKHTTLYVFLAAVRDWSLRVGFGELPSGFLLERVRQGIRSIYGVAEATTPKDALRHADLLAIRRRLDFLDWNSVCVWCMLTFAFFGLLRISEYTGGALRVRDVVLDDEGILLTIPVSNMASKWPRFETVAVASLLLGAGFGFTAIATNLPSFVVSVAI